MKLIRPSREHSVCQAVRLYNRHPGRGFGDQDIHLRRQQLGGSADPVQPIRGAKVYLRGSQDECYFLGISIMVAHIQSLPSHDDIGCI